jgi:23S rRNA (uracil1939-C5)-methyltransferase
MRDITLKIEKMTYGGSGLGHVDGKVCFVPYTAPGDLAQVRVRSEKKSYIDASLTALPEPSHHRVDPPCPVFGECGGCNWQHLPYDLQCSEKKDIFTDILWRSARVEASCVLPIIPSPDPYGYRARVQLKIRSVNGALQVGFYRSGSHYVVALPGRCEIALPEINHLLPELHELLRLCPEPDCIPQIDVAAGDDGIMAAVCHYIGADQEGFAGFLARNRALVPSVGGLYLQSGRKATLRKIWGVDALTYRIPVDPSVSGTELKLSFSPGGFAQINFRQNRALVETVLTSLGLTGEERVLDIFCGNGNFSLPLAVHCREVTGIEEYEPSIADARANARASATTNVRFICGDAGAIVREMASNGDRFEIVLLDPPRTGAADIARVLSDLRPAKIVYVSCDPPTLARDIGILRGRGYVVTSCRPVDMFPQTHHIESVTLLEPAVTGS